VLLARGVLAGVRRSLLRVTDRSPSFANVMSGIARAGVLLLGTLVALSIAVPSINAASIVSGLGITSVAIGFAFKDILQNTLAGLLLLFRRPFRIGDQIAVGAYEGTVEDITVRETRLRTFDGQRVLIPNQTVYAETVRVRTAFEAVRTSLVVGVDYEADLALARRTAVTALQSVDGVLADPAPEAYYATFGTSTIDLDLRYWTAPRIADARRVQDAVVEAVTVALDSAGIALPAEIVELDLRQGAKAVLAR